LAVQITDERFASRRGRGDEDQLAVVVQAADFDVVVHGRRDHVAGRVAQPQDGLDLIVTLGAGSPQGEKRQANDQPDTSGRSPGMAPFLSYRTTGQPGTKSCMLTLNR